MGIRTLTSHFFACVAGQRRKGTALVFYGDPTLSHSISISLARRKAALSLKGKSKWIDKYVPDRCSLRLFKKKLWTCSGVVRTTSLGPCFLRPKGSTKESFAYKNAIHISRAYTHTHTCTVVLTTHPYTNGNIDWPTHPRINDQYYWSLK